MAKIKKVPFFQQFNGPAVIGPVRVDIIGVGTVTILATWTALTLASTKTWITIIVTVAATYFAINLYSKAKEKASKGFLWHLGYDSGIWSIKQDPKKYEELNRMDVKDYFPDSTTIHFKD